MDYRVHIIIQGGIFRAVGRDKAVEMWAVGRDVPAGRIRHNHDVQRMEVVVLEEREGGDSN